MCRDGKYVYLVPVAETFFLSFPRRRESIILNEKGSFGAMDPRFRGGDSFSATDTT